MKKRYKFNPQTLTYEVIAAPFKIRFYRIARKILLGFVLASIVNFLFSFFFYTPKMYRITQNNNELLMKYAVLEGKIAASTKRLMEIKHRDQSVYRSLFGEDSLSIEGIYMPYNDKIYTDMSYDMYSDLMVDTWQSLDAMTRLLYLESVSFDQLQRLSTEKEKLATSVPAIWPIDKRFLRGSIGAFGGRNHPVLGRFAFHSGIDLGSRTGTPVYATGNGVVTLDNKGGAGYGKQILINHGFGYKTRYAHLSKINVVPGQVVRRGEVIGLVGNTGRSTGPHLHYEVIYRGNTVNPINYFRRDMSEQELQKIIESAKETTYEAQ